IRKPYGYWLSAGPISADPVNIDPREWECLRHLSILGFSYIPLFTRLLLTNHFGQSTFGGDLGGRWPITNPSVRAEINTIPKKMRTDQLGMTKLLTAFFISM